MYYLWLNEAQAGPYTLQQVQSMWSAGQITALTLFWQEGKADWQPLGDIISEIEPPSAPPPPMKTAVLPPYEPDGGHRPAVPYSPGVVPETAAQAAPEQIHWTGHPTWWKWGWWILLAVVLCVAAGGLFFLYTQTPLLALSPLPFALLIVAYVFIDRRATRYTVSSKRVSLETGILARKSRELRIQDIRSISADMNFLGYGDIEFSSAARDDADVIFTAVSRAAAVRDLVKKLQA
jgi:membrane protein YdbS with pleckstrin-like domain